MKADTEEVTPWWGELVCLGKAILSSAKRAFTLRSRGASALAPAMQAATGLISTPLA